MRDLGGFRVVRSIATSAFGEVYEALDERGEPVALKSLSALAGDGELRVRFDELASKLVTLRHPNVVCVRACSNAPGAPPLVAMDLVRGPTLAEELARGAMDAARARRIACDLCAGLEAVHAHGLVHGDVRPANVFLIDDGERSRAALSDVALLVTVEDPRGTKSSTLRSELAYMPADGLYPAKPKPSADVYAVGACLYEMLSGRRAFTEASFVPLMMAIIGSMPPSLASFTRTPPALAAIVERAMAKEPAARFASAAAMREALDRYGAETERSSK